MSCCVWSHGDPAGPDRIHHALLRPDPERAVRLGRRCHLRIHDRHAEDLPLRAARRRRRVAAAAAGHRRAALRGVRAGLRPHSRVGAGAGHSRGVDRNKPGDPPRGRRRDGAAPAGGPAAAIVAGAAPARLPDHDRPFDRAAHLDGHRTGAAAGLGRASPQGRPGAAGDRRHLLPAGRGADPGAASGAPPSGTASASPLVADRSPPRADRGRPRGVPESHPERPGLLRRVRPGPRAVSERPPDPGAADRARGGPGPDRRGRQ